MMRTNHTTAGMPPHVARHRARRGFTLVEMVVVISIVVILVTIGLPAAQDLWKRQRRANTVNLIEGMLKTTRARAIQGGEGETGLLFFVDNQGVQRAAAIRRADPSAIDALLEENGYEKPFGNVALGQNKTRYLLALENVFRVVPDRVYSIPAPNRVMPRYAVDETGDDSWDFFSDDELANDTFATLGQNADNNQRHRNFFTMVFTPSGELLPGRDVLIFDIDTAIGGAGPRGDVSGLQVGYDPSSDEATVTDWYVQDAAAGTVPLEPETKTRIPFLVHDAKSAARAVNFPSVDGLLLYDDDQFSEFNDPANKRPFVLRTAQPLYVNRLTGGLVRGPINENPEFSP